MTSESNAEPAEAWKMLDQAVVVRAVVVGQSSSGSRRRADVVVRHLFDPLSQCIFAGETLDLKDKDS